MNRFGGAVALGAVVMGLVAVGAPPAALAQMSSDQIIRSLQPGTRGIRQVPTQDAPTTGGGNAPARPSYTARPGQTAAVGPGTAGAAAATAPASVNLTVQFATGSAELAPGAMRTLDELGRALSSAQLSGFKFRIEGHTDTVGNPDSNKALSDARARKVLQYLVSKWHVDAAKVEATGMGQASLLVPTGPNVPELRNRRVTVINLGA